MIAKALVRFRIRSAGCRLLECLATRLRMRVRHRPRRRRVSDVSAGKLVPEGFPPSELRGLTRASAHHRVHSRDTGLVYRFTKLTSSIQRSYGVSSGRIRNAMLWSCFGSNGG